MQKKLLRICLILAMSIIFSSSALAGWGELDDGSWVYYNEDGTIATNSWKKSEDYWYYLNSDGNIARDTIVVDSDGEKYYVDTTGRMVANTWVQSDGDYYFASEEGKILKSATTNETIVKKIDGAYYTFGFDGKWIVQVPLKTGVSDNIYTNADLRYSIKIPLEAEYSIPINKLTIEIKRDLYAIMIYNFPMSGNSMEEIIANADEWYGYCMNTVSSTSYSEISKTDVQIGEYTLRKTHRLNNNNSIGIINYLCIQENGFFIINSSYYTGQSENLENIENIVNSLTMNK